MTCLPCAKEIINSFAATAWKESHRMAAQIPELVNSGRLKASVADELLQGLIAADQAYIDAVQAIGASFGESVAPPYPPEAASEEA